MWRFAATFALLVLAVPLVPFALFGELPGATWVEHPDPAYVFAIGVVLLAGDIFLPIPSSTIAVFLGARLGLGWGALAAGLGLSLGTALGYAAAWHLGAPLVARYASPPQRALVQKLESRLGYLALVSMRSIPVLAEASVLAAGAARWSWRRALGVLTLANGLLAPVYALFGALSIAESSVPLLLLGGIGVPVLGICITFLAYRLKAGLQSTNTNGPQRASGNEGSP